jgi:hypothetical protein
MGEGEGGGEDGVVNQAARAATLASGAFWRYGWRNGKATTTAVHPRASAREPDMLVGRTQVMGLWTAADSVLTADWPRPVLRAIGRTPLGLKHVNSGHPPSLKILWLTSAIDANVISAMKVDLKGRINNITLPISKPLLPVFEAIINGIHAVEDARKSNGKVVIKIQRDKRQSDLNVDAKKSYRPILNFVITDNGIGFTAAHYDSLQTSDSTLKMDRGAKGIGRFFWLKAFEQVQVSSQFVDNGKMFERSFPFSISDRTR